MAAENLFQRIIKVRKEISYIQKDKSVSTGGGSYRAVTHDMVTAMTGAKLAECGIVSYPVLVASKMNPPQPEGKQWRYEATYDFVFVNADDPQDSLTIRIEAHANDNADKAPGKAISYAKKYAILKLLDIETGEDEESRVPQPSRLDEYLGEIAAAKTVECVAALRDRIKAECIASGDTSAWNQADKATRARKEALTSAAKGTAQ